MLGGLYRISLYNTKHLNFKIQCCNILSERIVLFGAAPDNERGNIHRENGFCRNGWFCNQHKYWENFFSYKTAEAYKKKKSFLLFSKLQRVFLDTHREEGLFPDVTIEQ